MECNSIVFYRSFYDAVKDLPPEEFKKAVSAILEYGLNDVEPDTNGIEKTIYILTKPQIDANRKRRGNGNNGGRPKTEPEDNQTITKVKPKHNQTETKPEPNVNDNVNVNANVNENVNDNVSSRTSPERSLYPYKDIIDYLNQVTGSTFRSTSKDTRNHIKARMKEGYQFEDFKTVIDKKHREWKGTEFEKYLRPSTLFGSKFDTYLNQPEPIPTFANGDQSYDIDAFERHLNSVPTLD